MCTSRHPSACNSQPAAEHRSQTSQKQHLKPRCLKTVHLLALPPPDGKLHEPESQHEARPGHRNRPWGSGDSGSVMLMSVWGKVVAAALRNPNAVAAKREFRN